MGKEPLEEVNVNELLAQCTPEQRKWIAERLLSKSDSAAAKAIGIHPGSVARWKRSVDLDAIVGALLADPIAQALEIISSAVPDAAKVKIDGLKSRKDNIKQAAATEILSRAIGTPTQRVEHLGEGGGPVGVTIYLPEVGAGNGDEDMEAE
jgi:hypothetical protein